MLKKDQTKRQNIWRFLIGSIWDFVIVRMRFNTFAFRQEIFIRTLLKHMEKSIKIFLCYFSNDKNLIYKMVG